MNLRLSLREPRVLVVLLLGIALLTGFFATRWFLMRDRNDAVAVLTAKTGQTDRDTGKAVGAWHTAELRANFFMGDGARTGKASTATLTLADRSTLRLEQSTVVRFLDRPSPKSPQRVNLEMGEAVLEAAATEVTLDTDIGVAVLAPGEIGRASCRERV